ncbi:LysR family transcriptional regulator [Paenibacillus sp.]|jgi:DNA-binding transcriptional LysR family regulator|uniref:LysR family transcriptional regulator n=1 Tax=Paenibacillus sp. TaxID=58172 RepID=UPI002821B129|nr:LysR family transcriptional regulator [Paenibacillus sp.]MDR0270538.1 LysR family transcriptional regulator [Paenibacillus sp.]
MDIRQLKYFIAIAEERKISAAAQRLHLSQPPLSQQLKAMEEELGTILVERCGRLLELTESGKALYRYALQLTQLMDEAVSEVKEVGIGVKGSLNIGINTLSSVELPGLLHQFKMRYPHVTYKIQQNESSRLCELVRNRVLELAIIRLPLELDAFEVIHLHMEPFYFITSQKQPDFDEGTSLAKVSNYPLMLPSTEGLGVHYSILMAFSAQHIKPNIVAECSDIPLLLHLVASGFGSAIVPETVIAQLSERGIYAYKITEPHLSAATGLIWLKSHHLSAAAQHFVELIHGKFPSNCLLHDQKQHSVLRPGYVNAP